jgi:hypothetical protein
MFWEVVGLVRGPLSIVSTTEELLERKSSGFGLESRENGRRDQSRWPRGTLYPQKTKILMLRYGRAIAQAVNRWFPTAAARVRARVRSCGICGGQSGTGAGFLRVPRFLLPSISLTAPHLSSPIIIRGWHIRPAVASVIVDTVSLHPRKGKNTLMQIGDF